MIQAQSLQSDDDRLHVIRDDQGGCCWQVCSGGVCVRDRDGARLMARFRSLLISQGRVTPPS